MHLHHRAMLLPTSPYRRHVPPEYLYARLQQNQHNQYFKRMITYDPNQFYLVSFLILADLLNQPIHLIFFILLW